YHHHLEILTLSLVHDGRFAEARAIEEEVNRIGWKHWLPWFRLHLAERDWAEAQKIIDHFRRSDKQTASYLAALLHLRKGEPAEALPEIEVLQQMVQQRKGDRPPMRNVRLRWNLSTTSSSAAGHAKQRKLPKPPACMP